MAELPTQEDEAAAAATAAAKLADQEPIPDEQKQVVQLELTEIKDGVHFYAHVANDSAVTALQEQPAALCKRPLVDSGFEPKPGHTCCARFSVDDQWYRAKVVSRTATDFTVFFWTMATPTSLGATSCGRSIHRWAHKPSPHRRSNADSPICLRTHRTMEPRVKKPHRPSATRLGASQCLPAWKIGKQAVARDPHRRREPMSMKRLSLRACFVWPRVSQRRAAPLVESLREKELGAKKGRAGMWRFGDIEGKS